MRVVLAALLAFAAGAVLVYGLVVAGAFAYMHANSIFDRDDGMSMAIMFAIGPAAAMVGGVLAAIVTAVRMSRRQRAQAAGQLPPAKPWPLWTVIAGALLAGATAYLAAGFVLWAGGPMRFGSYWAAFSVSLLPVILAVDVAGLIVWHGLHKRTRPT
jgi:hypothetical protein